MHRNGSRNFGKGDWGGGWDSQFWCSRGRRKVSVHKKCFLPCFSHQLFSKLLIKGVGCVCGGVLDFFVPLQNLPVVHNS